MQTHSSQNPLIDKCHQKSRLQYADHAAACHQLVYVGHFLLYITHVI